MGSQHIEPEHIARPIGEQLVDRDEIAERLRHLLALHIQEAVMHPDVRQRMLMMRAFALRNFVFVMREDQIDAAAVNVDGVGFGERGLDHRGAFQMPAGAATTPRRIPARRVRVRRFPQHEIHRVLLVRRNVDAGAGDHVVERTARELAIVGLGCDLEQDVCSRHKKPDVESGGRTDDLL